MNNLSFVAYNHNSGHIKSVIVTKKNVVVEITFQDGCLNNCKRLRTRREWRPATEAVQYDGRGEDIREAAETQAKLQNIRYVKRNRFKMYRWKRTVLVGENGKRGERR